MNVYIVNGIVDYEGTDILGVFTHDVDAHEYISKYKKLAWDTRHNYDGPHYSRYDNYVVETHTVDDPELPGLALKADGA